MMVVFCRALFVFLLFLKTIHGRIICYQEHIHLQNKKDCQYLVGNFVFEKNVTCNPFRYKNIVQLDGHIVFKDIPSHDPLGCMPNLHRIFLQDDSRSAILIEQSVHNMEKFSYNKSLIITRKSERKFTNIPLIEIRADRFRMEYETYKNLITRFGSSNLRMNHIPHLNECNFDKQSIVFMNQLDDCEVIVGGLKIDGKLLQTKETKTKLHTIEGCLEIKETDLEVTDVGFLLNIRKITCPATLASIMDNPKLCLTPAFTQRIAKAHVFITQPERLQLESALKNNNGNPFECRGLCSAENIENEANCSIVWGDVYLRASILPKIEKMHTLKGRLIVYGFGKEDLFAALPNLTTIISNSLDPAIEIGDNRILKTINFPEHLNITSPAPILIQITGNFFYKMDQEQYDRIGEQYGKDRLRIDVLDKRECYFPEPIKNLSLLDDCDTIHGHFKLKGYVDGAAKNLVKVITGCVWIEATDLKNVDFLARLGKDSAQFCSEGHRLMNNIHLCPQIWLNIMKKTKNYEGDKRMKVYGNKMNCAKICSRDGLFHNMNCTEVSEGITMSPNEDENMLIRLVNLETVHGAIRIRYTNVSDINVFSSLREIHVYNDGPAIEIKHNENMTSVDFPDLKEIHSFGNSSKLIVIRDNGDYVMPYRQYKNLSDRFGEERLDIDHAKESSSDTIGFWVGLTASAGIGVLIAIVVMMAFAIRIGVSKSPAEEEPLLKKGKDGEKTKDKASTVLTEEAAQTKK